MGHSLLLPYHFLAGLFTLQGQWPLSNKLIFMFSPGVCLSALWPACSPLWTWEVTALPRTLRIHWPLTAVIILIYWSIFISHPPKTSDSVLHSFPMPHPLSDRGRFRPAPDLNSVASLVWQFEQKLFWCIGSGTEYFATAFLHLHVHCCWMRILTLQNY